MIPWVDGQHVWGGCCLPRRSVVPRARPTQVSLRRRCVKKQCNRCLDPHGLSGTWPRPCGVRRRYTDKQRRELIDLVTTGRLSISEAAAQLGVPLSTASY